MFSCFASSISRWSTVINFLVHSIMYSYFALKALRWPAGWSMVSRVPVPRAVSMLITLAQLAQFLVLTTVNSLAASYIYAGKECGVKAANLAWSSFIIAVYLLLFARSLLVPPSFSPCHVKVLLHELLQQGESADWKTRREK